MLKWFNCPDGGFIEVPKCLTPNGCRVGERCMSLRNLLLIGNERVWTGTPSVTQLINGTRMAWLRLLVPYIVKPKQQMWPLLGTRVHTGLEDAPGSAGFKILEEVKLRNDICTGMADLYINENGVGLLSDTKVSGSYKVAKALGLTFEMMDHPEGEVYKKSGKWGKAGEVKQVKTWTENPNLADLYDWTLQLNMYRFMLEKAQFRNINDIPDWARHGVGVDAIKIDCIVRDGNTSIAESRGIQEPHYLIKIPHLEDKEVVDYFEGKAIQLSKAITYGHNDPPPRCSKLENWDGRRCAGYCEVAYACEAVDAEMKCPEHTGYRGVGKPRSPCQMCWGIFHITNNRMVNSEVTDGE
jgi:hypothetical protein